MRKNKYNGFIMSAAELNNYVTVEFVSGTKLDLHREDAVIQLEGFNLQPNECLAAVSEALNGKVQTFTLDSKDNAKRMVWA